MRRFYRFVLVPLLFCSVAVTNARAADDLLIADFEGNAYTPWQAIGDAFGTAPARGALHGQMHVDGYQGQGLVNSFLGGDGATGELKSPSFTIERKFIAFLIGGGNDRERLAVQLLIGDKVVRSSTGNNDQPGGSESLQPAAWDVAEFRGQSATMRIIDDAKGGWGHINVDHIRQTDTKPSGLMAKASRQLIATARYLHLPIKDGAPLRKVSLLVDGQTIVRNDIGLADNMEPSKQGSVGVDWWAPMEISQWKGKTLTIEVDRLAEDSRALSSIEQSDAFKNADKLYQEPLRPQFHFSPKRGWNNDPNGLVYFNNEYHLFFQHNPYGWGWGNMHWGHAVSRDLVHWQELGETLMPDDMGPMFSGSAVVDWQNTSGFGKDGQAPLVLIYTAAGNPTIQAIAYSLDGRNFTKYSGNPVLPQITAGNRDPKVMWHEPTGRWIMVLYVEKPAKLHTVHIFSSPNLREWKLESVVPGDPDGQRFLFECPDMFKLPIDGKADNSKWVLIAADSQYSIGQFDGHEFKMEADRLPGQRGRGVYAPQTFSDIPANDGRRIQIGWFQTETKGMPFNQSMTVPLELKLMSTDAGPRLTFQPVAELKALRAKSHRLGALTMRPDSDSPLAGISAELLEFRSAMRSSDQGQLELSLRGLRIIYDFKSEEIEVDGLRVAAPLVNGVQELAVLVDRVGVEIFASSGLVYIPLPIIPDAKNTHAELKASRGAIECRSLEVHELHSAW